MSTGLTSNRFAELAKLGEVVFHSGDLANLWHITNSNTLHTTLKRYVGQGLLFRIHKGFYSLKPLSTIDPLLLGIKALHAYAYVSCETVLVEEGIIQQALPVITLIGAHTKHFSIGGQQYYSRKLANVFLYQENGITAQENGIRKASRERAIADLLYFNRRAYFDADQLVDWKKVRKTQQEIGYPLTPQRYG